MKWYLIRKKKKIHTTSYSFKSAKLTLSWTKHLLKFYLCSKARVTEKRRIRNNRKKSFICRYSFHYKFYPSRNIGKAMSFYYDHNIYISYLKHFFSRYSQIKILSCFWLSIIFEQYLHTQIQKLCTVPILFFLKFRSTIMLAENFPHVVFVIFMFKCPMNQSPECLNEFSSSCLYYTKINIVCLQGGPNSYGFFGPVFVYT